MKDFAYARAGSVDDAVTALGGGDTAVIAGGTELLNWFRLGVTSPARVVDIGGVDALRGVTRDAGGLHLGALTTLNEAGEHPLVVESAGALASACLQAASGQLRNRATLGGNVLQRTRCPYFRAEDPVPWPCTKRAPGSGCASLAGDHERQAIFGWTDACVAVHPSDPAVALVALDADVLLTGPDGDRAMPLESFLLTQREAAELGEPDRENRLAADEVITGYHVPVGEPDGQAYVKIRERASYEYAIVSAAASVRTDGDVVTSARIALGSVAQRPWRLRAAEAALPGTPLTRDALVEVVGDAMRDAEPLPQNAIKVTMARNAAVRALLLAGGAL